MSFFVSPSQLGAQVTPQQRDRRRAFVNDLLKTLIESQMERDPVPTQPTPPGLRPAFPKQGNPGQQRLPQGLVAARTKIAGWERESVQFVDMLRQEERRVPRVRPYLADALAVSAQLKSLGASANRANSLDPLADPFRRLDAKWRLLSHQLAQVNGLRPECISCMQRMSAFDSDLCGIFRVEPQFNRRELSRYCTQMASRFQHLMQDLRYDMAGEPEFRSIIADCQRLFVRLQESGRLIDRGSYESIVSVYQQSVNEWRELKYKLVACPHGRIQRDVHAIESIGSHIAELLWLPKEIDRRYLGMVIASMQRDANFAFQQVSLADILQSRTPGIVLASARDFSRQCQKLSIRLESNAPMDAMLWEYKQFSNQWQSLQQHLVSFGGPEIGRTVRQVDAGFQVLQGVFGDGPLIDRYTMNEICSELDQLTYRLYEEVQRRTRSGYDPRFQSEVCELSGSFRDCMHSMHDHAVQNRRHDANAIEDVALAVDLWTRLKPLLNQFRPADQRLVRELRGRIEPLMVKLQVIFAG